jgi:HlyD family secretion protein
MKRWLWIIALTLIAVAGIVWGMRGQQTPVEATAAKVAPLRMTVEEEGKTRLKSRYVISAPIGGFMRRLPLKAGDMVRAGQVITQLTSTGPTLLDPRTRDQSNARVESAEATLSVAEARVRTVQEQQRATQVDMDYWRRQLEREQKLSASGDIPAERLDRTRTELRRAEAAAATLERSLEGARRESEAAKTEIASAQAALRPAAARAPTGSESVTVIAPASGRVIKVVQESEGVVLPGTPLVEIGDANAIEVEVEVLSPDAVQIAAGTKVEFSGWGGEGALAGQVRVVEPGGFTKVSALGVEEQRVRVIADITSPETVWKRLGDGYRVEASFILWQSDKVLQVPSNALFRYQDGWAVFVIEDGMAKRRKVEVGHRTGLAAEILSGLKDAEKVVAHPDETVEDGKAVVAS